MIVTLRDAIPEDAAAITTIYAPYVLTSDFTFEEIAPDADEMAARMAKTRQLGLPYYVAEIGGVVVGYAYVSPFHPRAAYRYTLENSVYVASDNRGKGIGMRLMRRIIETTRSLGYRQMIALITAGSASVRMHEKLGFKISGQLSAVGLKFGRWLDVVEMQLALGDGASNVPQNNPGKA